MPNVIFARPRHDYNSYVDLYRLIELSGYPMCFVDEIDPDSDNTYICTILNGENQQGWEKPRARIILYDLEWHLDGVRIPGLTEVWAADAWYAGHIGAKYVPLGSHPDLALTHDTCPKLYDVATMMYSWGRRDAILGHLLSDGIRLAPRDWGIPRDAILHASRIMLHVHQHDNIQTVAPQRFALAAAYKLPMVSEVVSQKGIFENCFIGWAKFSHLSMMCSTWMMCLGITEWDRDPMAESLHQLLCVDNTFRKCVEVAL